VSAVTLLAAPARVGCFLPAFNWRVQFRSVILITHGRDALSTPTLSAERG
jgi:hypothetical protein